MNDRKFRWIVFLALTLLIIHVGCALIKRDARLGEMSRILGFENKTYFLKTSGKKLTQTHDFREYKDLAEFSSSMHFKYLRNLRILLVHESSDQKEWLRYNQELKSRDSYSINEKYRKRYRPFKVEQDGKWVRITETNEEYLPWRIELRKAKLTDDSQTRRLSEVSFLDPQGRLMVSANLSDYQLDFLDVDLVGVSGNKVVLEVASLQASIVTVLVANPNKEEISIFQIERDMEKKSLLASISGGIFRGSMVLLKSDYALVRADFAANQGFLPGGAYSLYHFLDVDKLELSPLVLQNMSPDIVVPVGGSPNNYALTPHSIVLIDSMRVLDDRKLLAEVTVLGGNFGEQNKWVMIFNLERALQLGRKVPQLTLSPLLRVSDSE